MSEPLLGTDLLRRGPDDADWSDVLRRSVRARHRRQASALAVLVVALSLGIAAAYAFGHPIIDFGSAPKGPPKIVNDFGSLQVGAPEGMAPGVLPHQARRITAVSIDGHEHVLWVAPTKKGGFCDLWTDSVGGCRADRHDKFARHIDVSGSPDQLSGSFFQRDGARLEVVYADGATDEIPFVWVTAPIDAGFYLYSVPAAHRVSGRGPVEVRLLDEHGNVLARDPTPPLPGPSPVMHSLPGYPSLSVPAEAVWDARRQLFDLRADDGAHIGLWVAPKRGGGTCYWTNQAFGCLPVSTPADQPVLPLGFSGAATHVTLCCTVGPSVARVEAVFQNGDRTELTPKEGYLIWPVPSRHYPVDTRLVELVGFDAQGRQVASRKMPSDARGLYPCTKPKDYGYGVSMCP